MLLPSQPLGGSTRRRKTGTRRSTPRARALEGTRQTRCTSGEQVTQVEGGPWAESRQVPTAPYPGHQPPLSGHTTGQSSVFTFQKTLCRLTL